MTFKVGDKVRPNETYRTRFTKDCIWGLEPSEVIEVGKGPRGCDIRLKDRVGSVIEDYWFKSEFYEIVEAFKPEFKAGDKVRRKAEFRNRFWDFGDEVCEVQDYRREDSAPGDLGRGEVLVQRVWYIGRKFELVSAQKPRPQAGEYWRQRDGKVVGPLKIDERSGAIHTGSKLASPDYWYSTGVWATRIDSSLDLVERAEVCAHCGQPTAKSV